jgi:pyridinium-3,5-biscarboxylic acid mononucleotide sulfurtransferase
MAENKKKKLDAILNELKSFVIAFSGGVDSSFLLYRAHSLKKTKMMGVTIRTPYIPEIEMEDAAEFARLHDVKHMIIDLTFPEVIKNNPVDRCYYCKKTLFSELLEFAGKNGFKYVIDGTNADDTNAYRPGLKALHELGIRSPLLEAGLTKKEIREMLRQEGLPVSEKPAMACLLTRIPYNTTVSENILNMIEQAEYFFLDKGFPGTRVRIHGNLARIECQPAFFEKIIQSPVKELITNNLKKIGFRYVSLDLEGYRSGSADQEIENI